MKRYCLDSDTFIQAKNRHYALDIVPVFWSWLDDQASAGTIFSAAHVYDEILRKDDDLANWIRPRKNTGLFVEDEPVQHEYAKVVRYVQSHSDFAPHEIADFCNGADGWVIAHAIAKSAAVVTHEVWVQGYTKKVKIPNICAVFHVRYIDVFQMLRELNARLG